jgi:hypothetical protein
LQLVAQTGKIKNQTKFYENKITFHYKKGEYAGEMIMIDKDGEVVYTIMSYVAIVKV